MIRKIRPGTFSRCFVVLIGLILILLQSVAASALSDSLPARKGLLPRTISYCSNLSASYTHYRNWKYNGINNYSFLVRENINYDSIDSKWQRHVRFNGELGYIRFTDSTWYKNTDLLDMSIEISRNRSREIENLFSFYMHSQFLSSYEDITDEHGNSRNQWIAGFGNPMTIDLGYGATWQFWKSCRINITYVTFRTSVFPVDEDDTSVEKDLIYKKSRIRSEYGLSLQTCIRKDLNRHVRWENNSRFFANAIHRDQADLDFRNRIVIKVLKCLDLIFDSRIRYVPAPPYQLQFRNELMLSFTLERW